MTTLTLKSERIYIGGLDPPQLRPSDVQKRLLSLDGIEIVSVDLNDSKAFYHVNARPLKEDVSALAIVTKNYNNVKWKGCKLTVQGARPHFLDRLMQERLDREAASKPPTTTLTVEQELEKTDTPADPLPRRLRIRQKYGAEAHRVDTKPCETSDYKSFAKIVSQMRVRRQRKSKGTKEDKTVSFYNRAVHMRFDDEEKSSLPQLVEDSKKSAMTKSVAAQKGKTTGIDGSDESDDGDSSEEENRNKQKRYEWSSEEGESDEEPETIVSTEAGAVASEHSENKPHIESATVEEFSKSDVQNDDSKAYAWSSDEENSSDDGGKFRTVKAESVPVSEFASAIDFDGDDDDDDDSDDDDIFPGTAMEVGESTENNVEDLQQDVEANLDLLSKLFPDLKKTAPKKINDEVGGLKPKWETGIMQRYDPTKESAQQYEIQKNPIDEGEESSESDSSSSDDNDDKPAPKVAEDNVYHEAKLEEVFRNARDSGEAGGFQVSSMFGEQPEELKEKEKMKRPEEAAGSFSFNFNVPAPVTKQKKSDENDSKFSFGFDVDDPAATTNGTKNAKEVDVAMVDAPQPEENAPAKLRRRGFLPPSDVVDQYYNKFFELNDGLGIQENPDGFRNDENVKNEWKRERHTLTQDWKRKRKYAQSRLQKKYKFR